MCKRITILIVLFGFLSFQNIASQTLPDQQFNCFSIIVGKDASSDGSVFLAHNEDDHGLQIVNMYQVPALQHNKTDSIQLKNGGKIPQVEKTNSYIWFQMPQMDVSDSYINEYGVVIVSDACSSRETDGELKDGGIIYWFRRLMAERSRSAKEAVKIGGKLIEEYGYASSGRTYAIADANEGWMLSAVYGKHWVAQRVPDDQVAVIPNCYTIGEIDLSDTTNFLGSPDIIDYAIQKGWYNPEIDGKFHFAKVYSKPGSRRNPGNVHRMWRGVCLISQKDFQIEDEFPFSIKPKKKISIKDLVRVLRDHYEGTELDNTNNYRLGNPYKLNKSTICSRTTQYGIIAQLRSWLPAEIGTVVWFAPHRPDSQALIPIYLGINHFPENFYYENFEFAIAHHYDPPAYYYDQEQNHAFWTFVKLAHWVDDDYAKRIKGVRAEWDKFEDTAFKKQKIFEKKLLKMYKSDPESVREAITHYTTEWLENARQKAKSLTEEK